MSTIDLIRTTGTLRGIIRYEDNTLIVCISTKTDGARPKEFKTRPGDDRLLLAYSYVAANPAPAEGQPAVTDIRRNGLNRGDKPNAPERPTMDDLFEDEPKIDSLRAITNEELAPLSAAALSTFKSIYVDQKSFQAKEVSHYEKWSESYKRRHSAVKIACDTLDQFDRWAGISDSAFRALERKLKNLYERIWKKLRLSGRGNAVVEVRRNDRGPATAESTQSVIAGFAGFASPCT